MFRMTTMRRVVGRCWLGGREPVLSFAGAVLPMTTTRLPLWVGFMAAPVWVTANKPTRECTDDHLPCQGAVGSEEETCPARSLPRRPLPLRQREAAGPADSELDAWQV